MQLSQTSLLILFLSCILAISCEKAVVAWQPSSSQGSTLDEEIWSHKPIGKSLKLPTLGPDSKSQWEAYLQDSISLVGAEKMIPLSLALFLEERQSRYIEVLERSFWNDALIGAYQDGDSTYHPGDLAFVSGPDSLFANLYVSGSAELSVNGQAIKITTTTRYPWEETVSLQIETEDALAFTLGMRIPGFSRNQPVPGERFNYLYISNRKLELRINEDLIMPDAQEGYAFVSRVWEDGDVIDLRLPMAVRRVRQKNKPSLIALERGLVLYGFPQDMVPLDFRLSKSRQYFLMDSLDGPTQINWLKGPIWHEGQMIEALAAPLFHLQSREIEALDYFLPYR